MADVQRFKVSTSGQISLSASVRRRWPLGACGDVDVIDLGFGILTLPVGSAGALLDAVLPAEVHFANVADDEDPDLATT